MTWFPLQAAVKMSTIPGAIRATLDALLDHINPAPNDPTRPDTLMVWESRELLAADAGFSEITVKDHLERLRGEKDLVKGQRVMVLKRIEDAGSHRAARYALLPAALDALVDPGAARSLRGPPAPQHASLSALAAVAASQMAPAEGEESAVLQAPDDESLGVRTLSQTDTIGVRSLSQLGEAPSPELPKVDPTLPLTFVLPEPESTAPKKEGRVAHARRPPQGPRRRPRLTSRWPSTTTSGSMPSIWTISSRSSGGPRSKPSMNG